MSALDKTSRNDQIQWHLVRWILWRFIRDAAERVLIDRSLRSKTGQEIRWLRHDINFFLSEVSTKAARLRQLGALPVFGSRLMVELAIYTVAADWTLQHVLGFARAP
jgi:hypothetical protein